MEKDTKSEVLLMKQGHERNASLLCCRNAEDFDEFRLAKEEQKNPVCLLMSRIPLNKF